MTCIGFVVFVGYCDFLINLGIKKFKKKCMKIALKNPLNYIFSQFLSTGDHTVPENCIKKPVELYIFTIFVNRWPHCAGTL